jgi:hypothetical protein
VAHERRRQRVPPALFRDDAEALAMFREAMKQKLRRALRLVWI